MVSKTFQILSNTFEKQPCDTKKVSKVTVVAGEMVKTSVIKNKFSQLSDKRFYFLDGIFSLPFHLPVLAEIDQFKQKKGQRIEKYFWEEKEHLFSLEKQALKKTTQDYICTTKF